MKSLKSLFINRTSSNVYEKSRIPIIMNVFVVHSASVRLSSDQDLLSFAKQDPLQPANSPCVRWSSIKCRGSVVYNSPWCWTVPSQVASGTVPAPESGDGVGWRWWLCQWYHSYLIIFESLSHYKTSSRPCCSNANPTGFIVPAMSPVSDPL